MKKLINVAFLIVSCILTTHAQDKYQELIIPLTDPAKPGTLKVNLHSGSMKVTGYSGKDVIIRVGTEQKEIERESKNGLRRIPNRSLGLSAKEDNNYVSVNSDNYNKEINLEIQVPTNFDLKLSGHNGDGILVENINGELDVEHHNDDITLIDISGSAVVNTHNGDIKVKFNSVTADTPMAFTTFNGDVDITFPANFKATFKMQSQRGEMYTDFDLNIKTSPPKRESNKQDGVYRISLQEWTIGDVNGGGPEILYKTYNGDIIIRKK